MHTGSKFCATFTGTPTEVHSFCVPPLSNRHISADSHTTTEDAELQRYPQSIAKLLHNAHASCTFLGGKNSRQGENSRENKDNSQFTREITPHTARENTKRGSEQVKTGADSTTPQTQNPATDVSQTQKSADNLARSSNTHMTHTDTGYEYVQESVQFAYTYTCCSSDLCNHPGTVLISQRRTLAAELVPERQTLDTNRVSQQHALAATTAKLAATTATLAATTTTLAATTATSAATTATLAATTATPADPQKHSDAVITLNPPNTILPASAHDIFAANLRATAEVPGSAPLPADAGNATDIRTTQRDGNATGVWTMQRDGNTFGLRRQIVLFTTNFTGGGNATGNRSRVSTTPVVQTT
jgi:hypothetical protein